MIAAAQSHTVPNKTSRQIIARNQNAGGASASSRTAMASSPERRATANAAMAKPNQ
jgi:hypothetical protein